MLTTSRSKYVKAEPESLRWVCTNPNSVTTVMMLENSTLRFQGICVVFSKLYGRKLLLQVDRSI